MTYNPATAEGVSPQQLPDVGAPALTDIDVLNRAGQDYRTSMAARHALFRQTPAGTRMATLPVTLTAADHDKNVLLIGTTGALTIDGTVRDGFRCYIYNGATGSATYSGIVGAFGTTALVSGATSTVAMFSSTAIASAPSTTSVTVATAYTSAINVATGAVGSPATITLTPTAGVWPTGEVVTLSQTGGTGTFSATTLAVPANSSAPLTATWTASAAGTSTISTSTSPSMANTTGTLSYVATAATTTTYSMSESATTGLVGVAVTLSLAPAGGSWPASTTLTFAATGATGTFSSPTLSPTGTATVTTTFTPSAAGTIIFSVTNNQGLQNPANRTYTASAVASAYTQALSAATGSVANPVTLTVTPTAGGWPAGTTVTPSVSPNAGTLSPPSITPPAGSTAALVFSYQPIASGTYSLNTSASPAMINTSGAQSYTVQASTASAYTMTLGASSGAAGAPVTITLAPSPGSSVWPSGETLSISASPNTGTVSYASGQTPAAGTTTPLTSTFAPSVAGVYTLSSTASPTMTNNSGAQGYTATGNAPSYPTITASGAIVQGIWDGNAGVITSSGLVTSVIDQSPSGNNVNATAGVMVGPNVNGFPTFDFAGGGLSFDSGLRSTGAWLASQSADQTVAITFKTGPDATLPVTAGGILFHFAQTSFNYLDWVLWTTYTGSTSQLIMSWSTGTAVLISGLQPNTVYKIVLRRQHNISSQCLIDYWINGGAKTTYASGAYTINLNWTNFAIGQVATAGAAAAQSSWGGFATGVIAEMEAIQGAVSDADVAAIQSYQASKWGT